MINKVVRDTAVNPCTEGSASCAPDSICVADSSSDSYTVSWNESLIIIIERQINSLNCFIFSANAEMDSPSTNQVHVLI